MKRHRFVLAAAMAILVAAPAAQARVVNIDLGQHGDHPQGVVAALYVGTAAAPDLGTVWNELQVQDNNAFQGPPGEFGFWTSSVTVSNLKDSLGVTTPIGATAIAAPPDGTGAFAVLQGSPNLGAVATNAVDLMRDYLIGFGDARTVELFGFSPFASVDLYLYGAGDTSNRDTAFSVTDILGTHTAATTGTITNDGNNPVSHVLTLGGDYVVLAGVLADAAGKIAIKYDNSVGSGEAPFNGIQAVYAVPEPASLSLAVFGVAALLRRKK